MPGYTRVITLRLKEGGVMLVAPATILPWPRVLSRNARHLQAAGLRRALKDPSAMQQLRAEYPQMLNLPAARAAGLLSDYHLVEAYRRASERGFVTIIFGHAESSYGEKDMGFGLKMKFMGNPAIAKAIRNMRAPQMTKDEALPPKGTPMPNTYDERLTWSVARSAQYIGPGDFQRFEEFYQGEQFAVTVKILSVWSASHVVGVGFVVDAALFAHALQENGSAALKAFDELKTFFDLNANPGSWVEMDESARSLAVAATTMGPKTFRELLRRVGHGIQVQGGDDNGPGGDVSDTDPDERPSFA